MRTTPWKSWLSTLIGSILLSSCAGQQTVYDTQLCAGVSPITLEVAAQCVWTNHKEMTCKNLNQWTEYLSAMPERADTDHPGKTLPAKGPAIAIPSEHVEHLLSLIDALCYKYHACTFEQQQLADGIKAQVGALRSSTEIVCP